MSVQRALRTAPGLELAPSKQILVIVAVSTLIMPSLNAPQLSQTQK